MKHWLIEWTSTGRIKLPSDLEHVMYSYKPLGGFIAPTTFSTFASTLANRKRRLLIPAGIFVLLGLWLLSPWVQAGARLLRVPIPLNVDNTRKLAVEDEWESPEPWDPEKSVYDDFPQLYFESSSKTFPLSAQRYNPYPDYDSAAYKQSHKGNFVSCVGPRGKRMNQSDADWLQGYVGEIPGYPEAPLGSNRVIGLDQDVCFDRYGKHGPYGYRSGPEEAGSLTAEVGTVAWDNVNWFDLQQKCIQENRDRFDLSPRPTPDQPDRQSFQYSSTASPQPVKRTAVLIRGYQDMRFTPELTRTIRSLITELALGTGGEYEVFLLYNVKGIGKPIDSLSEDEQRALINEKVPAEFRNITFLWNEMLWPSRYPLIPQEKLRVHVSQWLAVQYFMKQHPEFDFYWNWEMDVRYTGHAYDLASKASKWAKKQPRKGMWERNSRFYIPHFFGGNYSLFAEYVESRYRQEAATFKNDGIIWGPFPPEGQATKPWDIFPPTKELNSEWGVDEDADLITMLPMFSPSWTHYAGLGSWFNYEPLQGLPGPPRRATIVTFNRFSNRLLWMMEQENTQAPGHHMGSEQWSQAVSMHHGLKAIYVPQSVYLENKWPAEAAEFIFNNGDAKKVIDKERYLPRTGDGSGGTDSCFGLGREHPFFELSSYYYRAKLAGHLYRWWSGQEVQGIGGDIWEKEKGTYCLPPMLLHPIKDINEADPVP